jgi:hypothetical protein
MNMDLHEAWRKLGEEKLSRPIGTASFKIPSSSKHPVSKLIKAFKIGMGYGVAFEILFIYLAIATPQPIVKVVMVLVILGYLVFLGIHYRVLKNITEQIHLDQSMRLTLSGIYSTVVAALRFQQQVSWIIFPVCIAAGSLIGTSIKHNVVEKLSNPTVFIMVLVAILTLTIVAHYLAKWMNKIAYGKYLEQLKSLTDQLAEDNP